MRFRKISARRAQVISWSLCAAFLLPGCWWQRDAYTQRMQSQMDRFERDAEYDRVLGPAFETGGDFPMWIRPPKPTELRALPADLEGVALGLFQGSEVGGALIEFIIIGTVGNETLGEFEQKSFVALNKASKGPGAELKRQDPASVRCLHGGETSFEVHSGGAARQVAGSPPTNYQWVCYFAEEGTQKVMVAFIVPDNNYTAFSDAMVKCLESLALSSKVSAARSGIPAAPAQAPNF